MTLVELLIVITLISILAGLVISTLNVTQQRDRAEDGVKQSRLAEVVSGIAVYEAAEDSYPTDPNNDGDPSDDPVFTTYVGDWPEGGFEYETITGGYCVSVPSSSSATFMKFIVSRGSSDSCHNVPLNNCSSSCSGSGYSGCTTTTGITC